MASKSLTDDPQKVKEEKEVRLDEGKVEELRVSLTVSADEYPLLVTMLSGEKIRICCKPTDSILDIKKVLWAAENVKEDITSYVLRLKNAETFYQDKQIFRDFLTHFLLFREESFQDTLEAVIIDKKDIGDSEKRRTKIPTVTGLNRAQGLLKKKGSGATHKWQERYFVLQDNTLFYFGSYEDYDRRAPASEAIPMGSCIAEVVAQGRQQPGFHHVRNFSSTAGMMTPQQRVERFPPTPPLTSRPSISAKVDLSVTRTKGVNLTRMPSTVNITSGNNSGNSNSSTVPSTSSLSSSLEGKLPSTTSVRYIFRLAADAVGKREFLLRTKQSELLRLFVHAIQSLNLQRIKLIVLDTTKELIERANRDIIIANQFGTESKEAQNILRAYAYAQYPKLKKMDDVVLAEVLLSALSCLETNLLSDGFAQGFLKIGVEKIAIHQIKILLMQNILPMYRSLLEYLISFFYTISLHPETTGISTSYIASVMETVMFGPADPFLGVVDRMSVLKTLIEKRPELWPMTTDAYMHELRNVIYAATPIVNRVRRPAPLELNSNSISGSGNNSSNSSSSGVGSSSGSNMSNNSNIGFNNTPRSKERRSSRVQTGVTPSPNNSSTIFMKLKEKQQDSSSSGNNNTNNNSNSSGSSNSSSGSSADNSNSSSKQVLSSRVRYPLTFHFFTSPDPQQQQQLQQSNHHNAGSGSGSSVEVRVLEELSYSESQPFSPGRFYCFEDLLHPKLGNQLGGTPESTLGVNMLHHVYTFDYANRQVSFLPEVIVLGYLVQRNNLNAVSQITNYLCNRPPLPRKSSAFISSATEPSFLDRTRRQTLAHFEGPEKAPDWIEMGHQWARKSSHTYHFSRFVQDDDDDDFVDIDTASPPPETPRYGFGGSERGGGASNINSGSSNNNNNSSSMNAPSPRVKQGGVDLQDLVLKNRQQNLIRRAAAAAVSSSSTNPPPPPPFPYSSSASSSALSSAVSSAATTPTASPDSHSRTVGQQQVIDESIPPPPEDPQEALPQISGTACTHEEAHVYCAECKEALCAACDESIHKEKKKAGHVRGAFKSLSISVTVPPLHPDEDLPPPPPEPLTRILSDPSLRPSRPSSDSCPPEPTVLERDRRDSNYSSSISSRRDSGCPSSPETSLVRVGRSNTQDHGSSGSAHTRTDSGRKSEKGHTTTNVMSISDGSHLKAIEQAAGEKVLKPLAFSVDSSFESVMRYVEARNCFRKFLATEFSEENILFWDEVNKFCEADVHTQYKLAQHIFTTYFGPQATKQVNVRGMYSQLKDALTIVDHAEAVAQCTFLFLEAQNAVVQLLKYDSFSRFKISPVWQAFVDNFKQREWVRFKIVKMKKMHKNVVRVIQFDSSTMALTFFKPDQEGEFTQEELRVPAGSLVNVQLSVTNNKKLKLTFFKTDQRLLRNQKEWRLIFRTTAERERLARAITANLLLKQSSATQRAEYQPQPLMMDKKTLQAMKLLPIEEVASELHEYYVTGKKADGWVYGETYSEEEKTDPILIPWHHMNDRERSYERDVATLTIGSILELGYSIVPQSFDEQAATDLEEDSRLLLLVEFLSENAHDCWAAKKFKYGWTYGETRSETEKTHPNLIPYIDLDEADMDWNRQAAIGVLRALLERGFKIEPID